MEQGYITNDGIDTILTQKSVDLLEVENKDAWFDLLWNKYPARVGDRRIRHNRKVCDKLFKMRIKIREDFDKMMDGLQTELKERLHGGDMRFMVELERWLREERWKSYNEDKEEKSSSLKDDI